MAHKTTSTRTAARKTTAAKTKTTAAPSASRVQTRQRIPVQLRLEPPGYSFWSTSRRSKRSCDLKGN
jgi:hypothetical protein